MYAGRALGGCSWPSLCEDTGLMVNNSRLNAYDTKGVGGRARQDRMGVHGTKNPLLCYDVVVCALAAIHLL